jgi:hypothetical protein
MDRRTVIVAGYLFLLDSHDVRALGAILRLMARGRRFHPIAIKHLFKLAHNDVKAFSPPLL